MAGLFVGTLFRLQHWPGGSVVLIASLAVQAIFFLLVVIEIISSKKASNPAKLIGAAFYLLFPIVAYSFFPVLLLLALTFLTGSSYLTRARKKFIFTKREMEKPQFDSI